MPYFILDGYNVTRTVDRFSRGKPHEERLALLQFVVNESPQGKNRITIVYDGHPGRGRDDEMNAGPPRVVFSLDCGSADDWIKRLVDHESNPRDCVVVTADKTLARWVRGAKARVMSPDEFVALAKKPQKKASPREKIEDASVTDELKKIWLS